MRPALLLLGLLGSAPAWAQTTEYRRIHVDDGRVLFGAVEASTATGLEVLLAQGRTTVRYDQVLSLEEIPASAWQSQPSWTLALVLPPQGSDPRLDALSEAVTGALAGLPATSLRTADELLRLGQEDRQALVACQGDALCVQPLVDLSGASVALSVRFESADPASPVIISSTFPQAPRARREISVVWEDQPQPLQEALLRGAQLALHLQPAPAPRVLATAPTTTPAPTATPSPTPTPAPPAPTAKDGPSPASLRAMAWLPVPGLPSLARRDWAGFGTSWAVTVPGSLAMFGLAGQASFSRAQLAATGLGSFYVLTVATNTAIGLRGLDATVGITPLPEGGAMVQVQGPLGRP